MRWPNGASRTPPWTPDPTRLASRVAFTAANGKPEDLVALLRLARGAEAGSILRLRRDRRPWRLAADVAALVHGGRVRSAGPRAACDRRRRSAPSRHEADRRRPSGRRREPSSTRVLDALDRRSRSKAEERLSFSEWTAAHLDGRGSPCRAWFGGQRRRRDERSTLEAAASVAKSGAHARPCRLRAVLRRDCQRGRARRRRRRPASAPVPSGRRSTSGC